MIPIVIPSADRWDAVLTNIPGMILCVPEDQAENYAKHNKFEIDPHPPLKNLAAKRNYIIQKYGDVFMIDDDMDGLWRTWRKTDKKMTPEEAFDQIQILYEMAIAAGAFLFGFGNMYDPYEPIKLIGTIHDYAMGIRQSKYLSFSSDCKHDTETYINCLNILHHRYCFIDTRFKIVKKETHSKKGSIEIEKRDILFLRLTFGEIIGLKHKKKLRQYHAEIKSKW